MNESSEVKLHFLDYWRVIRSRWGIIALVFILVVTTAGVTVFLMPREYYARATLEVKPANYRGGVDVVGGSSGSGFNDAKFVPTQFQIIQKPDVLNRVIKQLKLDEKWAGGGPKMQEQAAYLRLARMLNLREVRNTDLIDIGVYSTDREDTARIANTIAQVYLTQRRELQERGINEGLSQLRESVDEQRRSVQEAAAKAARLRAEGGITDPDPETQTSDVTSFSSIATGEKEVSDAKAKADNLETMLRKVDVAKVEELPALLDLTGKQNAAVAKTVALNADALVEKARLLNSGLGENHPKVKALLAQTEVYSTQLTQALENVRTALATSLQITQAELKSAEDRLNASKQTVNENKVKQAEYIDAKGRYIAAKKLLEVAENSYQLQANALNVRNVPGTITEHAVIPIGYARPNIPAYMALATLIGLIVGIGLAFFLEYLDTSVKSLDDIEKFLGIPVLAVIPRGVGLLLKETTETSDAEAYRILRTNMEFNRKSPDANTITVISGGPGEGKSTTICNLAVTCARGGYNVLLVDADLRRPTLHTLFSMDNAVGLTNYLTSKMDYGEITRQTPVPNLSFIPSGKLPGDAVGILNSQRMIDLIATVKRNYDLVFFDSPPILGVSDGAVLASEVDLAIMVVQHRRFPRSMLQRVKQAVLNVGGNLLGVVLNNVNTKTDNSYQYYTSYNDYYAPQDKKKERPRLEPITMPAARNRPDHGDY